MRCPILTHLTRSFFLSPLALQLWNLADRDVQTWQPIMMRCKPFVDGPSDIGRRLTAYVRQVAERCEVP